MEPGLRERHAGCSRRIRILAVVDDFTRENLARVADTSLSGARVVRELTRLIGLRGLASIKALAAPELLRPNVL